jgi:hypothetical protein
MIKKVRRAVDHAQHLDHALDAVKGAKLAAKRGKNGKANLARRELSSLDIQILADSAGDKRFVGLEWSVARDKGKVARDDEWFVDGHWFGRRWQLDFQFSEARFSFHTA